MSADKWERRAVRLIHAVARNMGPFGVEWRKVAEELGESPKACESAFWRLNQRTDGALAQDARILRYRARGVPYAKMVMDFPGMTIEDLKERVRLLSGVGSDGWVDKARVGFFDIEVSRVKADLGIMLAWCIKDRGGPVHWAAITRNEAIDPNKQDRRVMQELVDALQNYDLLVTYYGTGMDIPWIRARALMLGIDFPPRGEVYHLDLYYQLKNKLLFHRKSLRVLTESLGIEGKTNLPPEIWNRARLGVQEDIEYVVGRCKGDVEILEQLFERVRDYIRITRRSI